MSLPVTCSQCRTPDQERATPRFLHNQRDRDRCRAYNLPVEDRGRVVWYTRYSCDCQWRARLAGVHNDLLPKLLPDEDAQAELDRRAAGRSRLAGRRYPLYNYRAKKRD